MRKWIPWLLVVALAAVWIWQRGPEPSEALELDEFTARDNDPPKAQALLQPGPSETATREAPATTTATNPGAQEADPGGVSRAPRPDTFSVLVLDADGKPAAGVSMLLQSSKAFGGTTVLETDVTDAEGIVRLPVGTGRKKARSLTSLGMGAGLAVAADLPHVDPIRLKLPHAPEAGESFTLQLPALASVVIEVLGPDGKPYTEAEAQVHSRWIPSAEVGSEVYGGYNRCPDGDRRTRDGVTRYDRVGFDIVLSTTVQARGYGSGWVSDHPGPTVPGEELRIPIQLGEAVPFLRCQLLAPDGQPLAHHELKGSIEREAEYPWDARSIVYIRETTDAGGFFEFPMRGERAVDFDRTLVVTRYSDHGDLHRDPDWSQAQLRLPRTLGEGNQIDLGVLQLEPPEILLEGRVLDERGAPLARVRMDVGEPAKPTKSWPWRHWERVYTDKQGRYVLRAFRTPAKVRITAMHKQFDSTIVEVEEFPERSFDIVLKGKHAPEAPATGGLRIALLTDPGVPGAYFQMELRYANGQHKTVPLYGASETPLALPDLEPGTVTAVIGIPTFDENMLTIDSLTLRAGEVLSDGRLLPLDLRGKARLAVWKAELAEGVALRSDKIRLRLPGEGRGTTVRTDEEGQFRFVLPNHVSQIEVSLDRKRWVMATVGQTRAIALPGPE